jgi:hypothetical protein
VGVLDMAKQWDSFMKLLVEANKQDLVSFLLPGAIFEKELNSEMQSRVLEADLLYVVTWDGMQVILHVEFQKRRDGDMGKRLWKYNAQTTIITDMPVCSYVIYLQHDGNVVQSPYELPHPIKKVVHLFFFDTVKLWEIPGAFLKQEGIEGLLPLLPLTQNGIRHEVIDDMIVSLDLAGKSDLLPLAYAFASLVFKSAEDRHWLRKRFTMLSEDIFEDSWAYQEMIAKGLQKGFEKGLHEGLHKGELQALRGVIDDVVQERFPSLVTLVSSHIQKMEDTTLLRRLSVKLSSAQTAQEAEQVFKAIVKDAQQH